MTTSPYVTPIFGWRTPEEYDDDWYTEFASMLSTMEGDLGSVWSSVSANSAYWDTAHTCVSANSGTWTVVESNSATWAGGGVGAYTPEYPGCVLRADGTNNVGTMTTGFDGTNYYTYYHWAGGAATLQDYDIVFKLQVPSNDWATASNQGFSVYYRGSNATNTNCKVDVYLYDTANAVQVNGAQAWTATSWTEGTINKPAAGTWTEDSWMTCILKVSALQGHWIEVSQVEFTWTS